MSDDNPTPVEMVRLLIADTDHANEILTDPQIQGYLAIEAQSVKRAAASACLAIANSELLVSKVIRTQDLQTDGAKVSAELRALAADLRGQAEQDESDGWGGLDVVDFDPYPLTAAEATEAASYGYW